MQTKDFKQLQNILKEMPISILPSHLLRSGSLRLDRVISTTKKSNLLLIKPNPAEPLLFQLLNARL
jgi:hypothetical protein